MQLRAFGRDARGNVTVTFAICVGAILASVGAAIDYSRAAAARTEVQAVLDATALMLAKEAANLTQAQLTERAQALFQASFKSPQAGAITVTPVAITENGVNTIRLEGSGAVDSALFRLFGKNVMNIRANSEVTWGVRRVELALALDNTGSMLQLGKLDALKTATHSLIDTLKGVSKRKGDVKISIVPFTTYVNVGTKNKKANWIDFDGWTEVDSFGLEAGLSTDWVNPKSGKKWTGCVQDRNQPYDAQDTAPTSHIDARFPAVDCVNPIPLMALSSNWKKLHDQVDAMVGDGTTNVSIGLAWAWHALSAGAPLAEGAAPAKDLDKVIILLTDGLNTENRWGTSSAAIDKRTEATCANIKKDGIKVYTVRVIEGNQSLLRGCASAPNMYFEVSQASQLNAVFKTIAESLATLRISK